MRPLPRGACSSRRARAQAKADARLRENRAGSASPIQASCLPVSRDSGLAAPRTSLGPEGI
eukprot:7255143-Alexandrium_andersonii.AAC.1